VVCWKKQQNGHSAYAKTQKTRQEKNKISHGGTFYRRDSDCIKAKDSNLDSLRTDGFLQLHLKELPNHFTLRSRGGSEWAATQHSRQLLQIYLSGFGLPGIGFSDPHNMSKMWCSKDPASQLAYTTSGHRRKIFLHHEQDVQGQGIASNPVVEVAEPISPYSGTKYLQEMSPRSTQRGYSFLRIIKIQKFSRKSGFVGLVQRVRWRTRFQMADQENHVLTPVP